MKAFITKYALTEGIQEKEGKLHRGIFSIPGSHSGLPFTSYFHNREFFLEREEAVKRAEVMRTKKLASLKKQIAKLEGMKFE